MMTISQLQEALGCTDEEALRRRGHKSVRARRRRRRPLARNRRRTLVVKSGN